MPVPVPVPAVPGAVPTRCRPVAVLVWNGIGTDRSSHRYGRSSGRCCPFPFPFLAIPVPVSGRSHSRSPFLGWDGNRLGLILDHVCQGEQLGCIQEAKFGLEAILPHEHMHT